MAEGVAALFPERTAVPEAKELSRYLRLAIEVQKRGMAMGKRPFGAILVGPDVPIPPHMISRSSGRSAAFSYQSWCGGARGKFNC